MRKYLLIAGVVAILLGYHEVEAANFLSNGLIAYWTLDSKDTNWNTTTTNDISGTGNTGHMNNMSATAAPRVGKIGQAFNFDGTDDYVESTSNLGISGNASRTISFWAKRSFDGDMVMVSTGTAGVQQMFSAITYMGNWYLNGFGANADCTFTPADNLLHHHVITYDGTTAIWYIDNVSIGSCSLLNFSADNKVRIGVRIDGFGPFTGYIDDVRIYNRALTSTEVAKLYRYSLSKRSRY